MAPTQAQQQRLLQQQQQQQLSLQAQGGPKRASKRLSSVMESKASSDDEMTEVGDLQGLGSDAGSPGPGMLSMETVQQPVTPFWKDEGGRSNHMTAVVVVRGVEAFGNVPVRPTLLYENYAQVEDASEILKVLSVEPKTVTRSGERVTVKFRIEKVSRRKDGRKFRLCVAGDLPGGMAERAVTTPIMVLSKRKSQHHNSNNAAAGVLSNHNGQGFRQVAGGARKSSLKRKSPPSQRARAASMPGTKADLAATHESMRNTFASLEAKLSALSDRVAYLEKENKRQAIALEYATGGGSVAGAGAQPPAGHHGGIAHGEPQESDGALSELPATCTLPATCAPDLFDSDLAEADMRFSGPDIRFNFGLPSEFESCGFD